MKKPEIKKDRKLTNLEVLQLHAGLKNLRAVTGLKLNYAISRTIQNLKPLVEAYDQEKLIPKGEAFKKYEQELRKEYEKLASAGGGKPKTRIMQTANGEFETLDIDFNGVDAINVRASLQQEYAEAIEQRKADVKEYNDWLNEECGDDVKLHKIQLSEMPQNESEDYKTLWDACHLLVAD
jgi:hypothetical protein